MQRHRNAQSEQMRQKRVQAMKDATFGYEPTPEEIAQATARYLEEKPRQESFGQKRGGVQLIDIVKRG